MDNFRNLTRTQIFALISGVVTVPHVIRNGKKSDLLQFIETNSSPEVLKDLEEEATVIHSSSSKGSHTNTGPHPEKEHHSHWEQDHDITKFLELPSNETVHSCYSKFYEATSNAAVELVICAVCAREVGRRELEVIDIPISSLTEAQKSRLRPSTPNSFHQPTDSMLLEKEGITGDDESPIIRVCKDCLKSLRSKADVPPPLSLANNNWIGAIPRVLSQLTLPEQLLIAHYHPRLYVFKLYPASGKANPEHLQRAMKGSVTTYSQDIAGVASMVEGHLMPRPPAILASLISIAFIGRGKISKKWLHRYFRIRRHEVHKALLCFKELKNHHYDDVEISHAAIEALPVDDVPFEIEANVRRSDDVDAVQRESAGYVQDDSENIQDVIDPTEDNYTDIEMDTASADVVKLKWLGTVDSDMHTLTANELMKWGLSNLWKDNNEGAYGIRRSGKAVQDFPHWNNEGDVLDDFYEKAFPILFPYGEGGFERARTSKVEVKDLVRRSLMYHDRRFRKHGSFPFVVFGIEQKLQALRSAKLQLHKSSFERDSKLLFTITKAKLDHAAEEETNNLPISDPAVKVLRKYVHASAAEVDGSNSARVRLRSRIWSTTVMLGPPSIWITINPSDTHDPIAQVFAGEQIDLDNFTALLGPHADDRATNVAEDPYAAAKFYHFIISAILEHLFGVKTTNYRVYSNVGVFGKVTAYFGMHETQGRGTLHFHVLLYLLHAPSGDEMFEQLKSESFRERIVSFIEENFRAYLPGLDSANSVSRMPKQTEVSYSRPPKPYSDDYKNSLDKLELDVARSSQVHVCDENQCLKLQKDGHFRCKRRAPWPIADKAFVTEAGLWGPKRLYPYLTTWVPALSVNVRCNNNGALLTNGYDASNITYYICGYAVKPQGKNYNESAVMARAYEYHVSHPNAQYADDIRNEGRSMIFRLVAALNREQELAAPMVMSYLMGWGDHYQSHSYTPIYWAQFFRSLLQAFPDLLSRREETVGETERNPESAVDNDVEEEPLQRDIDEDQINVVLDVDSHNKIYAKSQKTDYELRGDSLETVCLLDFFVDTYEEDISKRTAREARVDDAQTGPGRPPNKRHLYREAHPKSSTTARVERSTHHRNLPNFVGPWFPRRDDPEQYDAHCASMLTLLKPWRNIKHDLKKPDETWSDALEQFVMNDNGRLAFIISGVQYFHQSRVSAEEHRERAEYEDQDYDRRRKQCLIGEELYDIVDDEEECSDDEEVLRNLKEAETSPRERFHAETALAIAHHLRIFDQTGPSWAISQDKPSARSALGGDRAQLLRWKRAMAKSIETKDSSKKAATDSDDDDAEPTVDVLDIDDTEDPPPGTEDIMAPEDALEPAKPEQLKADQKRAYEIIQWHAQQTLTGRQPPPLRMIIYGEGGTGKSKVITTLTEHLKSLGVATLLVKSAYTGVAASLIEGKTVHTISMTSTRNEVAVTDGVKKLLQEFWARKKYLVIDEYSMIGKKFFANTARRIDVGMKTNDYHLMNYSFGGLNVILTGDLHQFAPVAGMKRDPLYFENTRHDPMEMKIGRGIYEEFTTVVILREQLRVKDPQWCEFLHRLRHGEVTNEDVSMLKGLMITKKDLENEVWRDAALITPRHAVRSMWNEAALRQLCMKNKRQLFIVHAEDRIRERPLSIKEQIAVAKRRSGDRRQKRKNLPTSSEIAIGMKVMVTSNIATDLDVTNGARGEIVDIVLHPDELVHDAAEVDLEHLPLYVLVKLKKTRAPRLKGLEPGIIPIEPMKVKFKIKLEDGHEKTVTRTQLPITGAYAFTDYRAQGQTIERVIVDIARVPTGHLTLTAVYVALSRSQGRNTIRLLRGFDEGLVRQSIPSELEVEDERLEALDLTTKMWWETVSEGMEDAMSVDE